MMNVNFNRLYKKTFAILCTTAVIISAAATMIALGASLILSKTLITSMPTWLPYVIGGAALLISTPISLKLILPNQLKVSKQLDNEHELKESVQTMVVFDGEEGSMLELQRTSADDALSRITPNHHIVKRIIIPACAALVGVALLVTGLVIPKPATDDQTTNEEQDEPFAISEWQLGALEELIDDVEEWEKYHNNSPIDPTVKSEAVAELNRLLSVLKTTNSKNKMKNEVTASITAIDLLVEGTSTYKTLAVEIYKGNDTYAKAMAREILNHNGIAFSQHLAKLRDEFCDDSIITSEDPNVADEIVTLEEKVTSFIEALENTILDSEVANKEDKLLVALTAFTVAFKEAAEADTDLKGEKVQSLFDKAFSAAKDTASNALAEQHEAKTMCKHVATKLSDIFGVPIPTLLTDIEPQLKDSSSADDSDESNNESSGGYGEGNELYGSSDLIYDPFNEDGAKYVIYGEVFDDYYKRIEELLIDGNLSDETKQILIGYFAALSDGTKTGK
ncbi:MAG: hypothetical protein J6Q69_06615 [Clostridia bacterium]|nr:hypothetical protein [Clostridia bacterium]